MKLNLVRTVLPASCFVGHVCASISDIRREGRAAFPLLAECMALTDTIRYGLAHDLENRMPERLRTKMYCCLATILRDRGYERTFSSPSYQACDEDEENVLRFVSTHEGSDQLITYAGEGNWSAFIECLPYTPEEPEVPEEVVVMSYIGESHAEPDVEAIVSILGEDDAQILSGGAARELEGSVGALP